MTAESSACPCTTAQDPQVISNPAGLADISYRVGDFTSFRRALLRPLPGEQAIDSWRPAPGDLGLQVLEWWAYLADVLTFYNERYANECYLGTATQQGSIANLVALLGYRPAPGIAATGKLAALTPAGQSSGALAIPAGLSLSSTASPGIPSQTFEADSAMTFTGPSNVPAALPSDTKLRHYRNGSPRSVLLAGRVTGVTAGDRLVLVKRSFAGKNDYWSLVKVAAVTPATDPATGVINTNVSFTKGGWGPTPPVPGPAGAAVRKPPPGRTLPTTGCCGRPRRPPSSTQPCSRAANSRPATRTRSGSATPGRPKSGGCTCRQLSGPSRRATWSCSTTPRGIRRRSPW